MLQRASGIFRLNICYIFMPVDKLYIFLMIVIFIEI